MKQKATSDESGVYIYAEHARIETVHCVKLRRCTSLLEQIIAWIKLLANRVSIYVRGQSG